MYYFYTKPSSDKLIDLWKIDNSKLDYNLKYNSHVDSIIEGKSGKNLFQNNFYKKIGIDIVVETMFDYPYPYYSEKTFRPIANKRPFIIFSSYGHLKFLKENYGFETFSNFWNEDYDQEKNSTQRMCMLLELINNFVSMPLSSIIELVKQTQPILENNFTILKNLRQTEIESVKRQLEK